MKKYNPTSPSHHTLHFLRSPQRNTLMIKACVYLAEINVTEKPEWRVVYSGPIHSPSERLLIKTRGEGKVTTGEVASSSWTLVSEIQRISTRYVTRPTKGDPGDTQEVSCLSPSARKLSGMCRILRTGSTGQGKSRGISPGRRILNAEWTLMGIIKLSCRC